MRDGPQRPLPQSRDPSLSAGIKDHQLWLHAPEISMILLAIARSQF
jgi:hypothetical protein